MPVKTIDDIKIAFANFIKNIDFSYVVIYFPQGSYLIAWMGLKGRKELRGEKNDFIYPISIYCRHVPSD